MLIILWTMSKAVSELKHIIENKNRLVNLYAFSADTTNSDWKPAVIAIGIVAALAILLSIAGLVMFIRWIINTKKGTSFHSRNALL